LSQSCASNTVEVWEPKKKGEPCMSCPEAHSQSSFSLLSYTFLILLVLSGCGGGGGDDASDTIAQAIQTTIGEMNPGSAAEIPFGDSTSAQISFSDLTGHERFIVAFYSLSSSSGSFEATLEGDLNAPTSLDTSSAPDARSDQTVDPSEETTARFHEFLRVEEKDMPPTSREDQRENSDSLLLNMQTTNSLTVGDERTVKVLNSLSSVNSYTTITAQVRYVTPHFIVLRDEDAENVLTDEDLRILVNPLEQEIENQYATFGTVSDIDENEKVFMVFSPVLNGLGGNGGIVTGYFFGGDLSSGVSSSNHGEYIYCHVPDPSGHWGVSIPKGFYMSNTGPHCMPHELQHAINYNMKSGSTDPGWANEGQSHLAEDIYSNFEEVSTENPSRVDLCLGSTLASFTGGTNLSQRGCSYLFFRYLYEQADQGRFPDVANGKALIYALHANNLTGINSIEAETGESIETLASDFFVALYLSNTGLSDNSKYNFTGINLRSSQSDNRGTILSGPSVSSVHSLPMSSNVSSMSSNYFLFTGTDLMEASNLVSLSGSATMAPGAHLIRIQDQ
jgi:hypothetical protein